MAPRSCLTKKTQGGVGKKKKDYTKATGVCPFLFLPRKEQGEAKRRTSRQRATARPCVRLSWQDPGKPPRARGKAPALFRGRPVKQSTTEKKKFFATTRTSKIVSAISFLSYLALKKAHMRSGEKD